MPVSRKKTGAQKCVIQRVKNNGIVVVGGIGGIHAGVAEEIPGMIESHQNHDDPANHIDRFDADARLLYNGLRSSQASGVVV